MAFVKSLQEIMNNLRATTDFYDAEILTIFWETKPDIVARLLPPPLTPAKDSIVMAFVAHYPRTNFDVTYNESALFLRAAFNGEEGNYCLSMPVTNDMAMAGGREVYGFPKKIADIHFKREGETVHGWTERRGVRFMEVRAKLNGKINDEKAAEKLASMNTQPDGSIRAVSYNFKYFPAPEGGTFDYNARLVRQETVLKPKEVQLGGAELIIKSSDYDPWAEVEVVKMLGAVYTLGDNSMLGGKVVAEVELAQFIPYAFLKWDMK